MIIRPQSPKPTIPNQEQLFFVQGPSVGKYTVDLPSFEALALPQLAPQPGVLLYVVDEIGGLPATLTRSYSQHRACPHVWESSTTAVCFMQAGVLLAAAGKMELLSPRFFPAVSALLDAAPVVIGTVPVARYGRSIPQVTDPPAIHCQLRTSRLHST